MSIGSWSYEWAKNHQIKSEWVDVTLSTQTWAKESISFLSPQNTEPNFQDGTLGNLEKIFFCENQISGRGQGKNTWSNSKSGFALLSTWVFRLKVAPPAALTLRIGLCLIRAACSTWPQLPWSLKAQNDLYLADKKVAGLLLESISQGANYKLLIGLGFNILGFPYEISTASCLQNFLQYPLTRNEWEHFLTRFYHELNILFQLNSELLQKILESQQYQEEFTDLLWSFSYNERESLKFYLNLNPISAKCVHINEIGDLQWR
jgi:BirA family biotin operon repressor/biotin-[acetyl-CoA-carboxylase] ligase